MWRLDSINEELLGILIIEGWRHIIWVRSEPDLEGTWHNALVFRRDGKRRAAMDLVAGLAWHLPPGMALQRALELDDDETRRIYYRSRQRPPLSA